MTKKMPERVRDARRFRREFIAMMWGAYNSSLEWNDVIQLMFEELLFFYGHFEHGKSPHSWAGNNPGERSRGLRITADHSGPNPDA